MAVPYIFAGMSGSIPLADLDADFAYALAYPSSNNNVDNLYLKVNAAVNKLDVFARSSTATPDAGNLVGVAIPDGNGNVSHTRGTAYLSGTSQFIMADAANYWSKGSLAGEIKTAYVYAIWAAAGGIVWALGGYSGFTRCPASTTATDDDFFLLEASSTYTKVITDYCVCVGRIRYSYNTADTPDHTIQATVLDAPMVAWNPPSDYCIFAQPTEVSSATDIAEASRAMVVVKQSGFYSITADVFGTAASTITVSAFIKIGSSTYGSAVYKGLSQSYSAIGGGTASVSRCSYLNVGDAVHLGCSVAAASGTRLLYGSDDANFPGSSGLIVRKVG